MFFQCSFSEDVSNDYFTTEIGKANLIREGNDVTIISYGMGVHWAIEVLEKTKSSSEAIQMSMDAGRIIIAADSLGASQAMINKAVEYSKERKQFNRVIGSFQAVKHMCAEMTAELEPCYSLVWHAAHSFDDSNEDSRLMSCLAKSHTGEVSKMVSKKATEVHGGMGFTDLLGLHFWFKRIGLNRHILGSPEIVREEAAKVQGL